MASRALALRASRKHAGELDHPAFGVERAHLGGGAAPRVRTSRPRTGGRPARRPGRGGSPPAPVHDGPARPARRRPRWPACPPTPASTSSKTSTGGASVSARRTASMVRASSPPEATFANGCAGSPGLAARRMVTVSPGPSPSTRTSTRAEAIASRCRVPSTSAASRGAARRRRAATRAPRVRGPPGPPSISLVEGLRPRGVRLDGGQSVTGLLGELDDIAEGRSVLALELVEQVAAGTDLFEARRVVLPRLDHLPQLSGDVGRVGHQRAHPAVRARRGPPLSPSTPEAKARRSTAPSPSPDDRGECLGRRGAVLAGLGQPSLFLFQPPVLVGVRNARGGDLVDLEAEHVHLAGPLLRVAAETLRLCEQTCQASPRRCATAREVDLPVVVERRVVARRTARGPGAGADRVARPDPEATSSSRPDGAHPPVDPRSRATAAGDRAGEDGPPRPRRRRRRSDLRRARRRHRPARRKGRPARRAAG